MLRHPDEGTLRRLLDEPVAVAIAEERHVDSCPRCLARIASMYDDDAFITQAFITQSLRAQPEVAGAEEALERFHAAPGEPVRALPRDHRVPARRPARRRRLLRPATAVTAALVLTGGTAAAAATHLVPIFQPERVTPVVVSAGDLSSLADLSRFGTFSGQTNLRLTPEPSASALSEAAGFGFTAVTPPAGVTTGSSSYWLIGPESAQLKLSVAKINRAALTARGRAGAPAAPAPGPGGRAGAPAAPAPGPGGRAGAPAAPAGLDGSVLQVSTGNGILEVWGTIGLPTLGGGNQPLSSGVAANSAGVFGASARRSAVRGVSRDHPRGSAANGASPGGAGSPLIPELPDLALIEIDGLTVSSSGVSLSTLESYLLSQPGISPSLAAEIRAIGDPSSTLPLPVPTGSSTTTVKVGDHQAVVYGLGQSAHVVVWAASGKVFAVLGRAAVPDLLEVARQVG
jgi:hypothetical protein